MHIYIDEAGRWPLAWPVYVWIVVCEKRSEKSKIFQSYKDSKKLSHKQRELLFSELDSTNILRSYGKSSAAYIDRYGIVAAIRQAIIKSIKKLIPDYKQQITQWNITLHIDGNTDFGLQKSFPNIHIHTYIKWDDRIHPISAASIVAKVLRDRNMVSRDRKYPVYWFAKHKWYGTQFHRDMIKKYWLSDMHRKSFCKNIVFL